LNPGELLTGEIGVQKKISLQEGQEIRRNKTRRNKIPGNKNRTL